MDSITMNRDIHQPERAPGANKLCKTCDTVKPIGDFGSANSGLRKQSECRQCVRKRRAEWGKANPEKMRAYDSARRLKRPRAIVSDDMKTQLWLRVGGVCLCCAQPIDYTDLNTAQVDHLRPLARGGSNATNNLSVVHAECNRQKHNKTLDEHWQYRFNSGKDEIRLDRTAVKAAIIQARDAGEVSRNVR